MWSPPQKKKQQSKTKQNENIILEMKFLGWIDCTECVMFDLLSAISIMVPKQSLKSLMSRARTASELFRVWFPQNTFSPVLSKVFS